MADHLDVPGPIAITVGDHTAHIGPPMGDPKTDITDVYAFLKPGDPARSVLVLNVNPLAPALASSFDSAAIYMINVDTNGDAVADRSIRIRFSEVVDGEQTATVHLATGGLAARLNDGGMAIITAAPASFGPDARITTRGEYTFFAGIRSDPFFFDLLGFIDNFNFGHGDFFADKNVFSIVLEVPNSALGDSPATTSLWARTVLVQNGALVRDDRMARAAINTVFNHGQDKNVFNSIDPDQDLTAMTTEGITFVQSFRNTLSALGGKPALATVLLPDVLNYDFSRATSYAALNGRRLQDDVIDISLSLVTGGSLTTDKVGPHSDYLSEFPYLGAPH
ncbi:MAG TPA: DUF4331 family protein [Candidatus Dormibacteraeota bacterium]|nr:DUF4331 family protein [Candidatus Dormibacteraeota bacterium]